MKPNFYKILTDCIETGTALGYQRAHKHTHDPDAEVIQDKIKDAIMEQISENFIFDTLP